MEKKHQVHHLIILDESGSMESIKKSTISGFNELVQTAKGAEEKFSDQEHFVTLVTFNGMGNKILHVVEPVVNLSAIDVNSYNPNASTPLFDAMAFAINKLKQLLHTENYNVLVTILTDGEENASREYRANDIRTMVEDLSTKGWTFTYIGTDHDVTKMADSLSIKNKMVYNKSESGMNELFMTEKMAREKYYSKISRKEKTDEDFYKEG
jgi:Mg-chelatase subunit ChlD